MASTAQVPLPRMSRTQFRAFIEDKPDNERWELIDGIPVMMAPPTLAHQVIAGNLQRLLSDALDRHNPDLIVLQRSGTEIGPDAGDYDPEPDILVIDADASEEPGKRYADRFYLAAEIVSASDSAFVQKKREVYKLHATCTCILIVEQDRIEFASISARMALGAVKRSSSRMTSSSSGISACAASFPISIAARHCGRGSGGETKKR